MRSLKFLITLALVVGVILLIGSYPAQATLKYKKDTGKKCTFCHSGIPEQGDEDPQLNEEGEKFKKNGYKLTKDQENGS